MGGWGIPFADYLAQLQGMLGERLTYAGNDYPAVMSQGGYSDDEAIEGMFASRTLTATVRTSDLATPPEPGSRVTARGVVYRVDRVERHAHGESWKITCIEAD